MSNDKCIAKWQKRLDKANRQLLKYGNVLGMTASLEIKIYEEIIKDLKRLG